MGPWPVEWVRRRTVHPVGRRVALCRAAVGTPGTRQRLMMQLFSAEATGASRVMLQLRAQPVRPLVEHWRCCDSGRRFPLIIRASAPRLGGAVKAPDVSTMQFIIRTGQTRAFGNVVVVGGALLSGLCGIAVPHVVHGMAQDRVHGPAPSIGAHRLKSGAPVTTGAELNSSGDPAPPNYAEQAAIFETLTPRATTAADATEPSADVTGNYLDLATALDEFEQDEARKEAWAVQNGLPSLPVCGPTCTAPPGPGQLPAVFVPPRDPMSVDHLPSQATVQTPPRAIAPPLTRGSRRRASQPGRDTRTRRFTAHRHLSRSSARRSRTSARR